MHKYSKYRARSRSTFFAVTPLVANVKIYKCLPLILALALTVSEI